MRSSKRFEVPCTVEIEQTAESLHAHAVPEDVEIHPGDRVLIHGAPSHVSFGQSLSIQCSATIIRAGIFGRLWARIGGLLQLVELYEVGFEAKESL